MCTVNVTPEAEQLLGELLADMRAALCPEDPGSVIVGPVDLGTTREEMMMTENKTVGELVANLEESLEQARAARDATAAGAKTYPCPYDHCEIVCTSPGQLGGHVSGHRNGKVRTATQRAAVQTLTLYCECGSALTLRGETHETTATDIERLWRFTHETQQQHRLVTANECNLQREYRRRRAGVR